MYNEEFCPAHKIRYNVRKHDDGDLTIYCKECERVIKALEASTWSCPVCGCNSNDLITNSDCCWCCGWEKNA